MPHMLHDHDDIFYTPYISGWRENPREALRIYMLEVVNGDHVWPWFVAIVIVLGAMLCGAQ